MGRNKKREKDMECSLSKKEFQCLCTFAKDIVEHHEYYETFQQQPWIFFYELRTETKNKQTLNKLAKKGLIYLRTDSLNRYSPTQKGLALIIFLSKSLTLTELSLNAKKFSLYQI